MRSTFISRGKIQQLSTLIYGYTNVGSICTPSNSAVKLTCPACETYPNKCMHTNAPDHFFFDVSEFM